MTEESVRIEKGGLRVEFEGQQGPTHLVVPLVFQPGKHSDIKVRIRPRKGVSLRNEVTVGDALQMTFSRSHATSAGPSFFISASHSRIFGMSLKQYEVFSLPDFRGILFRLHQYNVRDEAVGIQLAFPISHWEPTSTEDYFAEIGLEVRGKTIQTINIPREVHPKAGRVLYISGHSYHNQGDRDLPRSRFPYLVISQIKFFNLDGLVNVLEKGFDGIHFRTQVTDPNFIYLGSNPVPSHDFFQAISGFGLKFVYMDTCNSVQVVSSFRTTDIGALIASTESLLVEYTNEFEKHFYNVLGNGAYISEAFDRAATMTKGCIPPTRSGTYNPMFLDLKTDFSFREKV